MKTLISALVLLALAVPGAHAQDNQHADCDACNSIVAESHTVAIRDPADIALQVALAAVPGQSVGTVGSWSAFADPVFHTVSSRIFILVDPDQDITSFQPHAHEMHPTTLPNLDFSKDRRWVHVSGVALVDGQPVPNAQVNVIAELDGDFNKYQLAVADDRGAYNAWFHAPAAITHVTVDVQNMCSTGRDEDCVEDYSNSFGAGATATGANSY
jgi:hypothetical protein